MAEARSEYDRLTARPARRRRDIAGEIRFVGHTLVLTAGAILLGTGAVANSNRPSDVEGLVALGGLLLIIIALGALLFDRGNP